MTDAKRRRGKELRERLLAATLLVFSSPVLAMCELAIRAEGVLRREARGPFLPGRAHFAGQAVPASEVQDADGVCSGRSRGGTNPIAVLEKAGQMTVSGRWIKQWYLDEPP